MPIRDIGDLAALGARRRLERALHARVARPRHDDFRRRKLRDRAAERVRERSRRAGIVEPPIADRLALSRAIGREMAHRREEKGEPALVLRQVARLFRRFRHQDRVGARVERVEDGGGGVELIAADDDETAERARRRREVDVEHEERNTPIRGEIDIAVRRARRR